jgi:hypothetical protein
MYKTQAPQKVSEDNFFGEEYHHPAFGCIQISQWQGGDTYHTGSSVPHNTGFRFVLSEAKVCHNHGRDQHYAGKMIAEFSVTPLQFVEMMTSVGKGSGVPVTLSGTREDGIIPGIEKPKSDIRNARDHVKKNAQETIDKLSKAVEKLAELDGDGAISKKDFRTILRSLQVELANFSSNLSFPVEMAAEQAERTSSDIVRNAEAMVSVMLCELGTQALQQKLLENRK